MAWSRRLEVTVGSGINARMKYAQRVAVPLSTTD